MKIYVVRLNPDPRSGEPYSKYPTKKEYDEIHQDSPMNGFHEAVNFLPERGIVRGYLPPGHSTEMRGEKPFVLVTITAKTARIGGDQVVGIQAGCIYAGSTPRTGGTRESRSLGISWNDYCPASLSLLFPRSIPNARSLIIEGNKAWVRRPTYIAARPLLRRIFNLSTSMPENNEINSRFKYVVDLVEGQSQLESWKLESELSFEQSVLDAMDGDLSNVKGNPTPPQRQVTTYQYARDPKVAAYALKQAKGKCADCGNSPFISRRSGLPYLEVHHIKMLKDNGPDTPENVLALCPNCHRKRHFG